jgi:biotin carboxyl carrier protein
LLWLHSAVRNKIPLAEQATSGNLRPQQKAVHKHDKHDQFAKRAGECGMPDIKIVTDVAGRVCALPLEAGASVGDGDEIAFVEAMKMEIPVTSSIRKTQIDIGKARRRHRRRTGCRRR